MNLIYGYVPKFALAGIHHLFHDNFEVIDFHQGDYEKALAALERAGCENFITYNPMYFQQLCDSEAPEIIFVYDNGRLKKFKEHEGLMKKLEVMGPGEALIDTSFRWDK